jgi:SAM-dependent methyltransferase
MLCPLCESRNTIKFYKENGYTGNKCFKCKLVFIANKPTKQQLEKYYNNKSDDDFSLNLPTRTKEVTCMYSLSKIKNYKKVGNLLELGPGYGLFLLLAKKAGFNVSGVEVSQKQVEYLTKKLKLNIGRGLIEDKIKELQDKYYDVVYHRDVLSHMYDPVKDFLELNRILKEDGILVFETGNYGAISKFWYKLKSKIGYPEHLFFFSDESIMKLLEKSNFTKLKKYTISTVPLILMQLMQSRTRNKNTDLNKNSKSFIKKIIIRLLFLFSLMLGKIQPNFFPAKKMFIAIKNK